MRVTRLGGVLVAWLLAVVLAAPAGAASGDLDPDFGDDGVAVTWFEDGAYTEDVAVATDGSIVVVGASAGPSMNGELTVVRYLPDGDLDVSFGSDGIVTTPIGPTGVDEARAVAVRPNGSIVVAGSDGRTAFGIARYLADGTLDATFGGDGIVRTDVTPGDDVPHDAAIQPDGRIVVVGQSGRTPRFTIVRYRPGGSLDRTFAGDGVVRLDIGWSFATAVAIQPDGRVVVAGFEPGGLTLARFRRDGSLDRTFAGDGVSNAKVWGHWPGAVAIGPGGSILTAGDRDIFRAAVTRFGPRGRLDPTFDEDGVAVMKLAPGAEQGFDGLVLQPDGRIVAVGSVRPHEAVDAVIPRVVAVRLLVDGSLDASWGGDGRVVTRLPGGVSASGAVAQPDGLIVVGATPDPFGDGAVAALRYLP